MTLQAREVSFAYHAKHQPDSRDVFHGLTVDIGSGECVVVLGREGCGKSTFLFLLGGLLAPDAGTILLDGGNPHADRPHGEGVRRRLAMTFQFPEEQFLKPTVEEEFADLLDLRGIGPESRAERMKLSLERVGLDPSATAGRSPFTLSIGESRRLALALAYAVRPEALLLDEPTAGLDASGSVVAAEMIEEMTGRGATVVIATHDIELAARVADRVVILDGGTCAVDASADEVLKSEALLGRYGYGA